MVIAEKVRLVPLTPKFGAIIEGVDAKVPLSGRTIRILKDDLLEYKVLFFRNQNLDYDQQHRFASQFGMPRTDPLETSVEGYPGLGLLDNVPFFHSDWMFQEDPPSWSVLQMTKLPSVGGDTMFVDLVESYARLSDPLRHFLEELSVLHATSAEHAAERTEHYVARSGGGTPAGLELIKQKLDPRVHPLVRLIPETGRANYWICEAYTRYIVELRREESDVLLAWLFKYISSPEFVIRWRWSVGDVVLWDHRTTLHRGVKDYGPLPRAGSRVSVGADVVRRVTAAPS